MTPPDSAAAQPAPASARPVKLQAVLGAVFGLAAIFGTTIGAGILRTPGEIAAQLPSPALFLGAWIAGAVYALGGANAVCELATMLPYSGGQYHFARRAFGPYAGFVVGWNDWLSTSGTATAVGLVLAESVVVLQPRLAGQETAIAAATILAFTALVWRGVREGAGVQTATSLAKAAVFLVLIGAAVAYAVRHGVATGVPLSPPAGAALAVAFLIAMQSVIFTYDGWTGAIYFSEEMRDPARQIPRATFGGLASVAAIYLLVNVAFLLVVPISQLAGHPLAAGLVAGTIFGPSGDAILRVIIVVALLSAVNANLLLAPRVFFAMGRDGLAPRWASRVNAGGTPGPALVASAAVALLLLLTGTFNAVIAVLAFFFVATYTISFGAVFVLRRREPGLPRPWRARGHPWTTGFMLLASVAFLVGYAWTDPRNGAVAAGLVALSYPVFRLVVRGAGD